MHKLTRRNVIATISSSAVLLCPALLNAQTTDLDTAWAGIPDDRPIGEDRLITVAAGPAQIDVSDLMPGEVAVIARPTTDTAFSATGMTQYVAVHRRTPDQVAFGAANDREGTVQNGEYFVVNLVCTHRGKAIGLTGDPAAPFACTDRGARHASVFDASGHGISGAGEDENLSIPAYTLQASAGSVIVALA